jgi:hypothetical protein
MHHRLEEGASSGLTLASVLAALIAPEMRLPLRRSFKYSVLADVSYQGSLSEVRPPGDLQVFALVRRFSKPLPAEYHYLRKLQSYRSPLSGRPETGQFLNAVTKVI